MRRDFVSSLCCLTCRGALTWVEIAAEDSREVREGVLGCSRCDERFEVTRGIPYVLHRRAEVAQEIAGWESLAGSLGEDLAGTMLSLPAYPHSPWSEIAPDFWQLFEEIDFNGRRVVEIGAGRTWATRHVKALGHSGETVAVDVVTKRMLGLETADLFLDADRTFYERLCADMHHIPLPNGWADVVLFVATVHHSGDLGALFDEVRRLLKPGGRLVMIGEPSKRVGQEGNIPQNAETEHGINEHVYSYSEYVSPLERRGFRVRRIAPRSFAYRMLYPDQGFIEWILPKAFQRLRCHTIGRRLILRALRGRFTGWLMYRFTNLPLSLVATKR